LITLTDVKKAYGIGLQTNFALNGITLSFPTAGFILIHGPSGCGKSTLLNIIGQLDAPTSGRIHIAGTDTAKMSDQDISHLQRHYFGFLFQHFHLLEGFSALENVIVSLLLIGECIKDANDISQRLFSLFHLEHIKHRSVSTLSGGEAQRVAMMRALAKRPQVILADEPTGALDSNSRRYLLETLKMVSKEKLVIVVSHDFEGTKQYADRIISINDGRVVDDQMLFNNHTPIPHLAKNKPRRLQLDLITKRVFHISKHHFFWAITALSFSILTTLLTFGISLGSLQAIRTHPLRAAASNIVFVSRLEKTLIANSPLSLLRYLRPTENEVKAMVDGFTDVVIDISARAIFSHRFSLSIDGRPIDKLRIEPYYDAGNTDDFSKVLVNDVASILIGNHHVTSMSLKYSVNIPIITTIKDGQIAQDQFVIESDLNIVKIIEDIRFQTIPTIYYSHLAAKALLDEYLLEQASSLLGSDYSLLQRLVSALENDDLGNFEMMVAFMDTNDVMRFFETWDQDDSMACYGTYFNEREYLSSIMNTINYGLYFFVTINAVSGILTMVISLMHFYKLHRRRLAILWSLGVTRYRLKTMLRSISRYLTIMSLVIGLSITPIIQMALNRIILKQTGIRELIQVPYITFLNIPLGLVLILSVTMILIADVGSLLSTNILRTDALAEELKDDD